MHSNPFSWPCFIVNWKLYKIKSPKVFNVKISCLSGPSLRSNTCTTLCLVMSLSQISLEAFHINLINSATADIFMSSLTKQKQSLMLSKKVKCRSLYMCAYGICMCGCHCICVHMGYAYVDATDHSGHGTSIISYSKSALRGVLKCGH